MSNFILSVDDGCASDVRVAELAKKYNIETIFYWPVEWHSLAYEKGYEPLRYIDAEKIADHHTIGSHTITHRHLTSLPYAEALYEISESKFMLQELLSIDIYHFAPPRGYTSKELTEFTLKHYREQRLTKGEGLVHIHPNSGANNNVHWLDRIDKDGIDNLKEIWCHSWELDKYNLWNELERFLSENSHS